MFGIDDVISVGMGIGAPFLQDRLNDEARHDAQTYNTDMYAHRYQMQVADLKAAGLNPMLAYGQSPGSAPTSSAQSSTQADVAGAFNQSRATTAQVANVNADTIKKAAETRNTDADTMVKTGMVDQVAAMTSSALASAEQASAMAEQIKAVIPKIETEIQKMQIEMQKDKSNIQLNNSLIEANKYLNSLRTAEATLQGKLSESKQQEIDIQKPKVEALKENEKDRTMYGKTSVSGDIMQNFYRMVNPFNNLFGGK